MTLEDCLPAGLRGPDTTITPITAGLSGAGVHRVEAGGRVFVLKLSSDAEPVEKWRRTVAVQRMAASVGVAPRVEHADEARRAVVSPFAGDRPFSAYCGDPATRGDAIDLIGRTLGAVHALPAPDGAPEARPRDLLATIWSAAEASGPLPDFAARLVRGVLAEEPPAPERAPVLSHNDVNPGNLVFDGARLMLVDWDVAAPNDPFFDLATVAVFFNLSAGECVRLLGAHDGAPAAAVPAGLAHYRRMVSAMCGSGFLALARQAGGPGLDDRATLESAPTLGAFYARLRSGALSLATGEGRWQFGLALIRGIAA